MRVWSRPLRHRRWLVLGTAVLAACVALGGLGTQVHPAWIWWLQLFASVLPLTMGAFVLLFLALMLRARGRRLVVALCGLPVLVFGLARFVAPLVLGPGGSPPHSAASGTQSLFVLSYNLQGVRTFWLFAWQRQLAGTMPLTTLHARLLRTTRWPRPHVACFQEASDDVRAAWRTAVYAPQSSLAILTDAETTGGQAAEPQVGSVATTEVVDDFLVRAVIPWQGEWIAIYNLQLHSFSRKPWDGARFGWLNPAAWMSSLLALRYDYLRRTHEAARVRRLLDREVLPFIVCGDFNSTRHNWEYAHIARSPGVSGTAQRHTLTYPAWMPVLGIDHILVSQHWRVDQLRTWPTLLSDHRPIEARVVRNGR